MALKVSPLQEIKFFNVPKTVNMSYNPGIIGDFNDREFLLTSRNARRAKVEHKLETRSKDYLHWSFVAETSRAQLPLASMRNHYKRRWNNAFGKALKRHGFDYHGRTLPVMPGQPKGVGLTGTLEIRLFYAAHWEDTNPSRMLELSDNMVKGLMSMQRIKRSVVRQVFTKADATKR